VHLQSISLSNEIIVTNKIFIKNILPAYSKVNKIDLDYSQANYMNNTQEQYIRTDVFL